MEASDTKQGGFAARYPKAAFWLARFPIVNLFFYLLIANSDLDNYMEQVVDGCCACLSALSHPAPPPWCQCANVCRQGRTCKGLAFRGRRQFSM